MEDNTKNVNELAITDGKHEMRNTSIFIWTLEKKRELRSLRHG
jgi:hypothetical protein